MLGALFGFTGRLSRPGFWEVLFSIVLIDVLLVLGRMYVADSGVPWGAGPSSGLSLALVAAIPWVFGVFTAWSLLAAMVKRCHDRGRSGALILIGLIPVVGWLWLLIDLFVLEGEERRNRYGRPPHAPAAQAAPRAGFDWGPEPAAAPEPLAAAPAQAPPPEPAAPEPAAPEPGRPIPVLASVGALDGPVHEPEAEGEPEPFPTEEHAAVSYAEPELSPTEPLPAEEHAAVSYAEPEPLPTEPEPELRQAEAVDPAPVAEAPAGVESDPPPPAPLEPELHQAEAEAPSEAEPDLPLQLEPVQPDAAGSDRSRGDLRPLVLDRL